MIQEDLKKVVLARINQKLADARAAKNYDLADALDDARLEVKAWNGEDDPPIKEKLIELGLLDVLVAIEPQVEAPESQITQAAPEASEQAASEAREILPEPDLGEDAVTPVEDGKDGVQAAGRFTSSAFKRSSAFSVKTQPEVPATPPVRSEEIPPATAPQALDLSGEMQQVLPPAAPEDAEFTQPVSVTGAVETITAEEALELGGEPSPVETSSVQEAPAPDGKQRETAMSASLEILKQTYFTAKKAAERQDLRVLNEMIERAEVEALRADLGDDYQEMAERGVEETKKLRNQVCNSVRERTAERVNQALELKADPEKAKDILLKAREALTDPTLTMDDQFTFSRDVVLLDKKITEVDSWIAAYQKASEYIEKSDSLAPQERLAELKQAKNEYPEYPGLDELIAGAEAAAAVQEPEPVAPAPVEQAEAAAPVFTAPVEQAEAAAPAAGLLAYRADEIREMIDKLITMSVAAAQEGNDSLEDETTKARRTLQLWLRSRAEPKDPDALLARLKAWGMMPEKPELAPATSPLLSEEQCRELIVELTRRMGEAGLEEDFDLEDRLKPARRAVQEWSKTDRVSLPPLVEDLREWGLWPFSEKKAALPVSAQAPQMQAPQALTSPAVEQKAEPEIQAQPPKEQPPAARPVTVEESRPQSDVDDPLAADFSVARSLVYEQQWFAAIDTLEILLPKAKGRLMKPVQALLEQARVSLHKETSRLVAVAERVREEQPDDREFQVKAWTEVLNLNPKDEVANQALIELMQFAAIHAGREILRTTLEDARQAAGKKDLQVISAALGKAEAEAGRENLGDEYKRDAARAVEEIRKLRGQVRDELGVASTRQVEGLSREAYIEAKGYINQNLPRVFYRGPQTIIDSSGKPTEKKPMTDPSGNVIPPETEVEPLALFQYISQGFLSSLRDLAAERVNRVSGLKPDPEKAKAVLQEARALLTDPILTVDHLAALTRDVALVDKQITEVDGWIAAHRKAFGYIEESYNLAPKERLAKLKQAKKEYPEYSGIQELMDGVTEEVAATEAAGLWTAISKAKQQANGETPNFEQALATLADALIQVTENIPNPKPGSELAENIKKLKDAEIELQSQSKAYNKMMALVRQAQVEIEAYEEGKGLEHLNQARQIYQGLIEEGKKSEPAVVILYSKITSHQGDDINWAEGLRLTRMGTSRWREKRWQKFRTPRLPSTSGPRCWLNAPERRCW